MSEPNAELHAESKSVDACCEAEEAATAPADAATATDAPRPCEQPAASLAADDAPSPAPELLAATPTAPPSPLSASVPAASVVQPDTPADAFTGTVSSHDLLLLQKSVQQHLGRR